MKANIIYWDIPFSEKDEAIRLAGKLQGGSNALGFNRENKVWLVNQGQTSLSFIYNPNNG